MVTRLFHQGNKEEDIGQTTNTENIAICVRWACKKFGTKKIPYVILDRLNMTVHKGSIYGLLGASGCGKTTLLSCIVGVSRLNSGEIWVLGGKPGEIGSGVPGPRVGYMPQEVALYASFSIRETMVFFGQVAGMKLQKILDRIEFLTELLMLPEVNSFVGNLSGGQQRRVSLAATLLHEPELLILDEPTVGVDPLLRANIWKHLVDICKTRNTTIIITTHYIEEARQAHVVGILRGGYLLAEQPPQTLIQKYQASNLEDVFLKLSVIQNRLRGSRSTMAQLTTESIKIPSTVEQKVVPLTPDEDKIPDISGEFGDNVYHPDRRSATAVFGTLRDVPVYEKPDGLWKYYFRIIKWNCIKALLWKNFLWIFRNITMVIFILILPVFQTVLFYYCVGQDAKNLHLSVFNNEIDFPHQKCNVNNTCYSKQLSCNFFEILEENTLIIDYYKTENEAVRAVKLGKSWASLIVRSSEFSKSYQNRLMLRLAATKDIISNSTILIRQDKSNYNIEQFVQVTLLNSYKIFEERYLRSCNITEKQHSGPVLQFQEPVYGKNSKFADFVLPGTLLSVIFFVAISLTTGTLVVEKQDGTLQRSLVNGITITELLFGHLLTQLTLIILQVLLILVTTFLVLKFNNNGSLVLVGFLLLLDGICGMSAGFVIAAICNDSTSATYLSLGNFLPVVLLCGMLWPIEGMQKHLRILSQVLPLTKPTESLRDVISRGWNLQNPVVYTGYIVLSFWTLTFLAITIVALKFKKG